MDDGWIFEGTQQRELFKLNSMDYHPDGQH
jgi:hypothetical protein